MLYTQVSRRLPSGITWWLRRTPSSFAPSRSIARRLAWFMKCVRNSTPMHFRDSKACVSSSSFASVFSAVRCTLSE